MHDVKITVVKKLVNKDLIEQYGEGVTQCDRFKIRDAFVVKDLEKPEGFCSWAWADIQRDVTVLALGGNFPWVKKEGIGIPCCTDGFRPVVFKIERIMK